MSQPASADPRYPIGRRVKADNPSAADREQWLGQLKELPRKLRAAVAGLSDAQLETPYRDGGWTVRQVIHHVADRHANAALRLRLALTEDNPTVKPYQEARWAELSDARSAPIEPSLLMIEALHSRMDHLLRSLPPDGWRRKMTHPEHGEMTVLDLLHLYAWHGRHHTAHITELRRRQGW
jgi:uncharacterized damage-inducible protein DinB